MNTQTTQKSFIRCACDFKVRIGNETFIGKKHRKTILSESAYFGYRNRRFINVSVFDIERLSKAGLIELVEFNK